MKGIKGKEERKKGRKKERKKERKNCQALRSEIKLLSHKMSWCCGVSQSMT